MASHISTRALSRLVQASRYYSPQRLRFSTSTARRIETIQVGSTTSSEAALSSATVHAQSQSASSPQAPTLSEHAVSSNRSASAEATSQLLKYHVSRTPSNNLPVYHDTRNGNTRKETIIRKIAGDPAPLRDAIRELLDVDAERVWVGKVTGHVHVKGHHKPAIEKFLAAKGF
jgi:large subunit ribosomal protein L49